MQEALGAAEEARQKVIREETERRILFNKYQELKGNIRVMCRVRPVLKEAGAGVGGGEKQEEKEEEGEEEARIAFPDAATSSTQIDVAGPESTSSSLAASSSRTSSPTWRRACKRHSERPRRRARRSSGKRRRGASCSTSTRS